MYFCNISATISSSIKHNFSKRNTARCCSEHLKSLGNDFKYSEQPRDIKTAKKEEIVSTLVLFFKPSRRQFWENFQSTMIMLIY